MAVKRSIYLINSKFQLKFSIFATIIVLVPFALYPFIIYNIIDFSVKHCGSNSLASTLDQYQGKLVIFLIAQYIIYGLIIFIICIFLSHKIAGPLYKLKKYLEKLKSGQITGHLFFRKGDICSESSLLPFIYSLLMIIALAQFFRRIPNYRRF